jgi:hypothetical protein
LTIARVWEPEVTTVVDVKEVLSGITVTLGEIVDAGAAEEVDWAEAESMRDA